MTKLRIYFKQALALGTKNGDYTLTIPLTRAAFEAGGLMLLQTDTGMVRFNADDPNIQTMEYVGEWATEPDVKRVIDERKPEPPKPVPAANPPTGGRRR